MEGVNLHRCKKLALAYYEYVNAAQNEERLYWASILYKTQEEVGAFIVHQDELGSVIRGLKEQRGVLRAEDRAQLLEDVVYSALNDRWDELKRLGDVPEFVEVVARTARAWAVECFEN